ncbi:MAG: MBL fold metallo-hydrolase [Patescibacteria group bacterium]|nr:MBL fold metallo-hydrolase [Patescibacteria group bacterium]
MELIILGSGNYIPSKNRNAPGYLLRANGKNLVIDFGAGTLQSLLNFDVDYQSIDYLLLTHPHPDHITDVVPLLHACVINRHRNLCVIGWLGIESFFEKLFKLIESTCPRSYRIDFIEMGNGQTKLDPDILVKSRLLEHSKDCIGFRVEAENRIIAYSGDTDVCDNLIALSKNADLLISECSCPDAQKEALHLTPSEAGEIASRANARKLILSHLPLGVDENAFKLSAMNKFSGEVIVAADGMRIQV